jgi:hypothetical protein
MTASDGSKPMNFKAGPFQIIECDGSGSIDEPITAPRRRYSCPRYATCLDLAAALNWDSFTCRGCSGEIDETLLWRARQAQKRDSVAGEICEIPEIKYVGTEGEIPQIVQIAGKR